jgi:hypothetical protein
MFVSYAEFTYFYLLLYECVLVFVHGIGKDGLLGYEPIV